MDLAGINRIMKDEKLIFIPALSGMVAIAGMIRDEDVAVYVLGNRDHAEVRHALMYRVFDLFDKEVPRDWSSEFKILYDGLNKG